VILLEVPVAVICVGRVRTDLAAESERGLPV